MTRVLIVNADDFGLTPGVSAGILAAHRHGIVTSTTVLVNRAILPVHIDAALGSGIGVGLHINLTLGSPITGAPSLVDRSGRFIRDARQEAQSASPEQPPLWRACDPESEVHRRHSCRAAVVQCLAKQPNVVSRVALELLREPAVKLASGRLR